MSFCTYINPIVISVSLFRRKRKGHTTENVSCAKFIILIAVVYRE